MSYNKFKVGDEVIIDLKYDIPYSTIDMTVYNGKLGIVEECHYFICSYCYKVSFEGDTVFLPENMLNKITEEQSFRELLLQNKELLLSNRKAIDKSLELIEIMLNK